MNGKQLKNSILQWAIQGKLVPQDPNDKPASVLLKKIRAEKSRLVKDKKTRKIKTNLSSFVVTTILLTAQGSIQDKEEGYESDADSYLTKPFSAKLLNNRVHNLLESRRKLTHLIANRTRELKPEDTQEPMK